MGESVNKSEKYYEETTPQGGYGVKMPKRNNEKTKKITM